MKGPSCGHRTQLQDPGHSLAKRPLPCQQLPQCQLCHLHQIPVSPMLGDALPGWQPEPCHHMLQHICKELPRKKNNIPEGRTNASAGRGCQARGSISITAGQTCGHQHQLHSGCRAGLGIFSIHPFISRPYFQGKLFLLHFLGFVLYFLEAHTEAEICPYHTPHGNTESFLSGE